MLFPSDATTQCGPGYTRLTGLLIQKGKDKPIVFVAGDQLIIEGDPKYLNVLASSFQFESSNVSPQHHLLEYCPEHPILNKGSSVICFTIEWNLKKL